MIFPEGLLPEEKASAQLLVKRCGNQAQAVLDELSARLQAKAVRTSPIAYLRGLVNRAIAGEFVPELGQRVAAARLRSREEAISRNEREAEGRRLAAERATPEYQAKVAARRAALRELLDSMQARHQRGRRS